MKRKKLLCLGVAVMLVAGNAPQRFVFAQNNGGITTSTQGLSVNSLEEGAGQEIPEEGVFQEERQLDGPEQENLQGETAQEDEAGQEDWWEEADLQENAQEALKGQESAEGLSTEVSLSEKATYRSAESDYEYEVDYDEDEDGNEYGIVWITGYNGTETAVKIPEQINGMIVGAIESEAFKGRGNLVSIELPSGVTYIGSDAFSGCSGLKEIRLPSGLTRIGNSAFSYCSSLAEIELPSGVAGLEGNTFSGCSNLKEVKLPSGLTSIGNNAFVGCKSLTGIELPFSVMSIGDSAFSGCSGLTGIELPTGVTSIGDGVFDDCGSLLEIVVDGANPNYQSSDGILYNKEKTELISCPGGKTGTIVLPSSVTSVRTSAFSGCSGLEGISLPSGLTSVGSSAFSGCSNLKEIKLPSSVTDFGGGTFEDCSSLTKIELSSGLTDLGGGTFKGCSSLKEIELPTGVTSLGMNLFVGCSSLTRIKLPSGLTEMGWYALGGCSSLKEIELPSSLTTIGYGTFSGCSSLNEIKIPSSLSCLTAYAFEGCSDLERIEVPSGVTLIVETAFTGCDRLTMIVEAGSYAENYAKEHNIPYKYKAVAAAEQAAKKSLNAVKSSKPSVILYTGKVSHTETIKPVYPKNFTAVLRAAGLKVKSVTYSSSQPKTVSVTQKGVVAGLRAGSATVTMTVVLNDGSRRSFQIKVTAKKPYLKVSGSQSVKKGRTLTFKVQKYGVKGTALWSIDKPKLAKINAKTGRLTAKAAGTVRVTVKVGNLKKTYKVIVKK